MTAVDFAEGNWVFLNYNLAAKNQFMIATLKSFLNVISDYSKS